MPMLGLWSVSLSFSHALSSLQMWAEGSHLCFSEPGICFHSRAPPEAVGRSQGQDRWMGAEASQKAQSCYTGCFW